MLRTVALTVIVAIATGCATQPIASGTTPVLGPSRVLVQAWAAPAQDRGILLISRDRGGFYGDGFHSAQIFVNGTHVGEVRAGEQMLIYPPLGDTILGTRLGPPGYTKGAVPQTSITLKPGIQSKIRIGLNDTQLFIEPSAF